MTTTASAVAELGVRPGPEGHVTRRYDMSGIAKLGDGSVEWSTWSGQRLRRHFTLDCETELIRGPAHFPELAMISVSDGQHTFILPPHDLSEFLLQHLPYDDHMTCHNVAFDFWVMDGYLADTGATEARSWLWSAVDQGRVHDTMLLAGLVTLAQHDDCRCPSLADACRRWLGIELEKDKYRNRYAETIGVDWRTLESGFFEYSACDAAATYRLHCRLTAEAYRLTAGLPRPYGFLTEAIQVKAAITLAAITRRGLHLDLELAEELKPEMDAAIGHAMENMLRIAGPDLVHRYKKTGLPKRSEHGQPKMNHKVLQERLRNVAEELGIEVSSTPTGRTTTSVKEFWSQYRDDDPFLAAYCEHAESVKLRQFLEALDQPTLHPSYTTFVRTGRTSCSHPNIQQLPRGSRIREIIRARPGHLLFRIDYSSLELVTLAAVCQQRYGFSRLGDVLRAGIDPHRHTAAMFAGMTVQELSRLPNARQLRQQAKAINFGIPGGLGAASLVTYARQTYGVTITQEQAVEFRAKLTQQVYPELQMYLSEDLASILAANLQAEVQLVRATWPKPQHLGMVRKVILGNHDYDEGTVNRVWNQLAHLNRDPELTTAIVQREIGPTSPLRRVLMSPVTTPTGRVRGGVNFTAARNTPFQGLAADGAKLAMWELIKAGYRIVAFVHDEFIIELSSSEDLSARAGDIERICCSAMQQLVGDIPVKCEYAAAERWYKSAEAVYDDNGRLQPWSPTGS